MSPTTLFTLRLLHTRLLDAVADGADPDTIDQLRDRLMAALHAAFDPRR